MEIVLVQSLQSNQEATELLENVRKNKEELQTELEKLKVCISNCSNWTECSTIQGVQIGRVISKADLKLRARLYSRIVRHAVELLINGINNKFRG